MRIILIAFAILFLATPACAYDQTYVLTQDDFNLTSGNPIPLNFTLTLQPSDNELNWILVSEDNPTILSSYISIAISPDRNTFYAIRDSLFSGAPNAHLSLSGNDILDPAFKANSPIYTKIEIGLEEHNSSSGSVYTLNHSALLGSAIIPDEEPVGFPIEGTIKPSAPVVESITVEQYTNMEWYTERHFIRYIISDRNGYDDITSFSFNISPDSNYMYNHTLDFSPDSEYPNAINTTHASYGYGIVEMFPGINYSITISVTDSSGLSDTKTILYTPHPLTPVNPEPEPEPLFSVDPIYFCDTQAGFNAVGNLTLHNHNGPTVKISSTFFEDFHIFNGGNLVGQIAAINLRYSIPTTTLSANESVTFPLKLYIPLGTKAGTIHSAGRIELTTV